MHGLLEAPRCSAVVAIYQPTMPSKEIHHKSPLSSPNHFQKMSMATHGSVSSTPIPKDLPPLLRGRAVAFSGKPVEVNIRRKCSGYRFRREKRGFKKG